MRPDFLVNMSYAMADVYAAVVDQILINLAKYFPYIEASDEALDLFTYQARMLAQMGQVTSETAEIIKRNMEGADAALRGCLETAIVEALKDEEPALRAAAEKGLLLGGGMLPPVVSPNMTQAFTAYYRQSADKLNLVNTVMLDSTGKVYQSTVADITAKMWNTQEILNTETGRVVSGVSTWNEAMHSAVKRMVDNGITGFIDHGGNRWSPEAYAAMDIRTTMFNTARRAVLDRNEEYGNDLIQVSYHPGARELCYPWQGKIISTSGTRGTVRDLYGNNHVMYAREETSWGEAAGIFGVNCQHYAMVFIPGFSVIKGKQNGESPEDNAKTIALNREQRMLESRFRQEKRYLDVMKARGEPEADIRAQKQLCDEASSDIDAFCDRTGRRRRRNREFTAVNATWPKGYEGAPLKDTII